MRRAQGKDDVLSLSLSFRPKVRFGDTQKRRKTGKEKSASVLYFSIMTSFSTFFSFFFNVLQ